MAFVPNPGRTLVIPADIGSINNTRLSFPNKPQLSTLDFSVDLSEVLAAEQTSCAAVLAEVFGPPTQQLPLAIAQQPTPGPVLTAFLEGGDLDVTYALRFTFSTAALGSPPRIYALDCWLQVGNLANYSGGNGAYMANTGYPSGVGPQGPPGAGITTVAPDSGLVIVGTQIAFNGNLLPTSPDLLPSGAPWNNGGTLAFAP